MAAGAGNIADAEMLRTFNCGIGMIVCVAATDAEQAQAQLEQAGEQVSQLDGLLPPMVQPQWNSCETCTSSMTKPDKLPLVVLISGSAAISRP